MNNNNIMVMGNEKIAPSDATETSARARPAGRSRTGKIARLPLVIRQELNRRLQDGQPGPPLLDWLNALPEAQFEGQPIGKMNLSAWRHGGYQDWLEQQQTLEAVATVLDEAAGLQAAAKEDLVDGLTLVLTAQMAQEIKKLRAETDGEKKSKIWRELMNSLVLVRRGNIQGERLQVEREKIGLRKEMHMKEIEAKFWERAANEDNRVKILDRLLTPEQNEEEIKRRNAEKQRKIKDILGIPW